MKYGLGIDTGGTYTDAIIYDFEHEKVVESTKSLTIKEDLKVGIKNGLNQLPKHLLTEVKLVSLSTTLATNAAVEGKVARGTLILVGCDRETVIKYGGQYGLPDPDQIIFIDGGHNQQGEVISEPDWSTLKNLVDKASTDTDGFAVVQKWGMRNPEFEKKAKIYIRDWTGLPVVCAHELLGQLNFLKRAATTLLNVKLIPLIDDFMNAVKVGLEDRGIDAPLVIVRGDGSLMAEKFARERPLETLLSGPAASVVGGINLTNKKNSVIVDMGGTTSDLSLVKEGRLKLARGGIDVGAWKTGTKSIYLNTIGLGGDSCIELNKKNKVTIGPKRVAPLSWLASNHPVILDDIESYYVYSDTVDPCELYYLTTNFIDAIDLTTGEKNICSVLEESPMSLKKIADNLSLSIYDLRMERLIQKDIVVKSALTPTDIMHITGDFQRWERRAAEMGAAVMAKLAGVNQEELCSVVIQKVKKKLYLNIIKLLLESENNFLLKGGLNRQLEQLILMSYQENLTDDKITDNVTLNASIQGDSGIDSGVNNNLYNYVECGFNTDFDIIGIGAPSHVFIPDVARAINTNAIIPDNAPVANAVGAITGNISVEEEVMIKPVYSNTMLMGYDVFSSERRKEFEDYDTALSWAKNESRKLAEKKAVARGAGEIRTFVDIEKKGTKVHVTPGQQSAESMQEEINQDSQDTDSRLAVCEQLTDNNDEDNNTLLLETIVRGRAIGTCKWLED